MGHLNVTIPKVPVEQRTALVKNLTETVANVLRLPDDVRRRVSIRLDMYEAQEMARDGRMLTVKEHPLSHIHLFVPELPFEQKRELVKHLTTALCDTLGFRPEQRDDVFITFTQLHLDNVASGGRLMAEPAMA